MNAGYGKNWPKVLNLTRELEEEEFNRRLTQMYAENFANGAFLIDLASTDY